MAVAAAAPWSKKVHPLAAGISAGSGLEASCSRIGNMLYFHMRVIARNTLVAFWQEHPETQVPLDRWFRLAKAARWTSMDDIQKAAPKAKVLNGERVRFEVAGGNYRMVIAFDFRRQIAFVKFVGSHAQYDNIDPLTVSRY
jgi:mRNA interferase HigB